MPESSICWLDELGSFIGTPRIESRTVEREDTIFSIDWSRSGSIKLTAMFLIGNRSFKERQSPKRLMTSDSGSNSKDTSSMNSVGKISLMDCVNEERHRLQSWVWRGAFRVMCSVVSENED